MSLYTTEFNKVYKNNSLELVLINTVTSLVTKVFFWTVIMNMLNSNVMDLQL
jgi:hypothetical protein